MRVGHLDQTGAIASARTWRRVRSAIAALALLIVLAPPVAAESFGKCRQMSRQIAHFYDVREQANRRGNKSWQRGTERHIVHLELRMRRLCPGYLAAIEVSKYRRTVEEVKAFMRAAAKAAVRYFTFGF